MNNQKAVAVIGAGPAGLMAAETMSGKGLLVHVFDSMPSPGLKFLRAGKGGLNITHSEPLELFLSRYTSGIKYLEPMLRSFGPEQVIEWMKGLGFNAFKGSSGRIFPNGMKAVPVLKAWLARLEESGVIFFRNHRWIGWDAEDKLVFEIKKGKTLHVKYDAVVLALGGGSWRHLGSDAAWIPVLEEKGIAITRLRPSNCGFKCNFSDFFKGRFEGQHIKNIGLFLESSQGIELSANGDISITSEGIEGGPVYFLSSGIVDLMDEKGNAIIHIDLLPGKSLEKVILELSKPRGSASMSNHMRKRLGIEGAKAGLLREVLPKEVFSNIAELSRRIKYLPLELVSPAPIDKAISTSGGVCFTSLDPNLMVRNMKGLFIAGEMLDWDAPTGGYLLTACLSTGKRAGEGVLLLN